ncbi:MAG: NUDIX domain-containing protein [Candidatus Nanosalina sp.]
MSFVSWFLSTGERLGIRFFSYFFWPPASASAVVIEDDKLLAVRTQDYLMLPGGLMESGEDFQGCALRETREETGIEIEIEEEISSRVKKYGGVEKIFSAEVSGGELNGSWEGKPEYVPLEDVSEEEWRWNRDVMELVEESRNSK